MPIQRDEKLFAFGRRVAELRIQAGLTQQDLAVRMRCTVNYVQYIERGTENLGLLSVLKLASVLNVEPAELLKPPASIDPPKRGRPPKQG